MSINPVFCNIYLWFNLSAASFFLCVFVFHSVLLLVNSHTCYICCPIQILLLFVGKRNKLTWLVSLCDAPPIFPMICSWLFFFLSFSLSSLSFFYFTCPTLSFSKLLATSHIELWWDIGTKWLMKIASGVISKEQHVMFKRGSIDETVESMYDSFYKALAEGKDVTLLQTDFCKIYDYGELWCTSLYSQRFEHPPSSNLCCWKDASKICNLAAEYWWIQEGSH